MTEEELAFLEKVFPNGMNGRLIRYPKKRKQKLIILKALTKKFNASELYNEKEVNEILKVHFDDFVTIRRDLYEYKFIDRKDDGSEYWIMENKSNPIE